MFSPWVLILYIAPALAFITLVIISFLAYNGYVTAPAFAVGADPDLPSGPESKGLKDDDGDADSDDSGRPSATSGSPTPQAH